MMFPRGSFNQSHVSKASMGTVMFLALSNHWSPVISLEKRNLWNTLVYNPSGPWQTHRE